MANREAIIAIKDGPKTPRKVVRLVATRDGSFSISVPYHSVRAGTLFKVGAPPLPDAYGGGYVTAQQQHRVDSRVKLSYHVSGFVQFSSAERNRIRSGQHGPKGFHIPKGLAINTNSLLDPIDSGPSIGAQLYGLKNCQPIEGNEAVPVMLFREGQFFDRDDHEPGARHDFHVEIFVFPAEMRRGAEFVDDEWVLRKEYAPSRPEWEVEFKVFDLPIAAAFLGIVVSRQHWNGERVMHSGYGLASARDRVSGLWLIGSFPLTPRPGEQELPSIEYVPDEPLSPGSNAGSNTGELPRTRQPRGGLIRT